MMFLSSGRLLQQVWVSSKYILECPVAAQVQEGGFQDVVNNLDLLLAGEGPELLEFVDCLDVPFVLFGGKVNVFHL